MARTHRCTVQLRTVRHASVWEHRRRNAPADDGLPHHDVVVEGKPAHARWRVILELLKIAQQAAARGGRHRSRVPQACVLNPRPSLVLRAPHGQARDARRWPGWQSRGALACLHERRVKHYCSVTPPTDKGEQETTASNHRSCSRISTHMRHDLFTGLRDAI